MTRYEDFKRPDDRKPEPMGTWSDLFKHIKPVETPPVEPDDKKETP